MSSSSRDSLLAKLFEEKRERRRLLLDNLEVVIQALQYRCDGHGCGPSGADYDVLQAALAKSELAEVNYFLLLEQVVNEIIAEAGRNARSSG
jgi:hypothetical protein